MKSLVFLLHSLIMASCAGITTPFGGDILISEDFVVDKSFQHKDIHIKTTPERQYYNSPYNLKLKIFDPNFDLNNFRYEIIYNNKKLNRWFKSEDIKIPNNKDELVEISFKDLSLLPGHINKVVFVYYPSGSEKLIVHS